MLLKFKFKNYKSFKDEVCLDLTATKITEFSERNFKVANIKDKPDANTNENEHTLLQMNDIFSF